MKTCAACKQGKPSGCFGLNNKSPDKLHTYCKDCVKSKAAISREKRRAAGKIAAYQLLYNYGISTQEYSQMFNDQGGCCKGCGRHQDLFTRKLCVDHCHTTGKVRGLLCVGCNHVLGLVVDNAVTLANLSTYLFESVAR